MLKDACPNFGFLSADSECVIEHSRKNFINIPAGTMSDYGDIVGPSGLVCLSCGPEYEVATCDDFGENESSYCPDGYISYPAIHSHGEITTNQKMCMGRLVCFTCNSPYVAPEPYTPPY